MLHCNCHGLGLRWFSVNATKGLPITGSSDLNELIWPRPSCVMYHIMNMIYVWFETTFIGPCWLNSIADTWWIIICSQSLVLYSLPFTYINGRMSDISRTTHQDNADKKASLAPALDDHVIDLCRTAPFAPLPSLSPPRPPPPWCEQAGRLLEKDGSPSWRQWHGEACYPRDGNAHVPYRATIKRRQWAGIWHGQKDRDIL